MTLPAAPHRVNLSLQHSRRSANTNIHLKRQDAMASVILIVQAREYALAVLTPTARATGHRENKITIGKHCDSASTLVSANMVYVYVDLYVVAPVSTPSHAGGTIHKCISGVS